MKSRIVLVVLVIIAGCSPSKPQSEPSQIGKFQLLAATYDESEVTIKAGDVSTETHPRHTVFKIDTSTGKTWMYNNSTIIATNGIQILNGWKEVEDHSFTKFKNADSK